MIDNDTLDSIKTIVVHDNCPDGLASAILLHDVLYDAEIKFVQYGTDAYKALTPAPGVLYCDFSPPIRTKKVVADGAETYVIDEEDRAKLQEFVAAGTLVLDHHKTAKPIVEAFGDNGRFGDEVSEPGVCGALLAYRHVWLPLRNRIIAQGIQQLTVKSLTGEPALVQGAKSIEDLAKQLEDDLAGKKDAHDEAVEFQLSEQAFARDFATLAGIRDTWQNKNPRWRGACVQAEVLRFFPSDDWLARQFPFHAKNREWWEERYKLGDLLVSKHEKSVKKTLGKAWQFTTPKGTKVAVFEGVQMTSDGAEMLDTEVDLVVGFAYEVEFAKEGVVNCPFHDDNVPSLKLDADGTFFCYSCQRGGKQEDFFRVRGKPTHKLILSTRSHTTFNCAAFAKSLGGGGHTKAAGCNQVFDPKDYPNPYAVVESLVQRYEVTEGT